MSLPPHIAEIDWNSLEGAAITEVFGQSRTLELLTIIYDSEDLEEREEAVDTGGQWFDDLQPMTPYWVRSLLPILSQEQDLLLPDVLLHLSLFASNSSGCKDPSKRETALRVLREIRAEYDRYLRLFQASSQWRIHTSRLLSCCPERGPDFVPIVLDAFRTESNTVVRASLLMNLGPVREFIADWHSMLTAVLDREDDPWFRFIAATEWMSWEGDATPLWVTEIVERAERGNPCSFWDPLMRALQGLSRRNRIQFLLRVLLQEPYTANSLEFAKLLLESVYGELGVTRWAALRPDLTVYEWMGPARTSDVSPEIGDPDWLGVLLKASPLWRENHPYPSPKGENVRTNLFELFGLPRDREGLVHLWQACNGERN